MVDRYYAKEPMDDLNKVFFAFAAYNAGPGRVRQLRREAGARGLDPNIWFNNVERVASGSIRQQCVDVTVGHGASGSRLRALPPLPRGARRVVLGSE